MTLDLTLLSRQITAMIATHPWREQAHGLDGALRLLRTLDPTVVKERIDQGRTSWLVAGLRGDLASVTPCPPLPPTWRVIATDGSFIPPDRHAPLHFFVINVGVARLVYGSAPDAWIDHTPRLYAGDEETHLTLPGGVRRLPFEGNRLGALRAIRELEALADLAEQASDWPTVALQDGTLLLWSLQNEERFVQGWAVDNFLRAADRLRLCDVPLAAYLSAPNTKDVVHALRVGMCPHVGRELRIVDCERCPSARGKDGPACHIIPLPLTDGQLFARVLRPGERSDLFASASKVVQQYRERAPDHAILFFYLNTGSEIARVEIPQWVAADADHLSLVQAAIVDQARRGQGYPTALQEAHEAAVIHADERRLVLHVIEEALAREGKPLARTGKDTSKRVRAI